jgi:hypothetical protein
MLSQREDGRNCNILWNELNPFEISYQALRRLLKQQQMCKSIPPNIHTRFSTSAEARESRSIPPPYKIFDKVQK